MFHHLKRVFTCQQPIVMVLLMGLLNPTIALAEPRALRGQVLLVGNADETQPAAGSQVVLQGFGNPVRTGSDGSFKLFVPEALRPGDPINLQVTHKGYRLWTPLEGRTLVPQDMQRQVLELKMLPAGSRRFMSDEGIEALIRESAERSKEQVNQEGRQHEAEMGRYISEWARRYGLSAHQVKAEVDRWVVEVEKSRGNERKLALAAFARGDYAVAADHAGASAEEKLRQLEQLEQEKRRLQLEAAQDLTLRGDAHFNGHGFSLALETYERALRYVLVEDNPELWAQLQVNRARAHRELGRRAVGA